MKSFAFYGGLIIVSSKQNLLALNTSPRQSTLKLVTSSPRGFTLIEILVVIAIIAVMSTLTFGVMKGVSGRASSAESLGQLRQIGVGISLYTNENNGRYPYAWNPVSNTTWRDLLEPYMDTDDSSPDNVYVSPTSTLAIPADSTRTATYAINGEMAWAVRQLGGDINQSPVTTFQVAEPSKTILVADTGQDPSLSNSSQASFAPAKGWWYWNPDPGPWLDEPIPVDSVSTPGTEPPDSISYRDNDHAAALMADGHAQRFARGAIKKRNVVFQH